MSESKVKPEEHFLFRSYTKAVKEWLKKNTYLSTYPDDENVTVVFMTPEKAFAEYMQPVVNGATVSPNINFYLSSNEYIENENNLGWVKQYKNFDDNKKTKIINPPLVYRLTYSCTIYTRNLPEMDVILFQILSKTSQNRKAAIEVDGQWAEIKSSDPTNETNLEPAERQDIIHRWALDLTIPRAYIPAEFEERPTITGGFDYDFDTDSGVDNEN